MERFIKYIALLLLSSFSFSSFCQGWHNNPDCTKCDIQIVINTNKRLQELTRENIHCFLLGFDKSCSNNVEYSEFSNEVLFKVVYNYPNEFINALSNMLIDQTYILEELSNPVLDFEWNKIITVIKNTEQSKMKNKILYSLKKIAKK